MLDNYIEIITNLLAKNENGVSEKTIIEYMVKGRKMQWQATRDAIYMLHSMGCLFFSGGRYHLG